MAPCSLRILGQGFSHKRVVMKCSTCLALNTRFYVQHSELSEVSSACMRKTHTKSRHPCFQPHVVPCCALLRVYSLALMPYTYYLRIASQRRRPCEVSSLHIRSSRCLVQAVTAGSAQSPHFFF